MGTMYQRADADVLAVIEGAMHSYHQRLEAIGLKLSVLMASAEEDESGNVPPALKLHGYPCYAITKILNLKMRAHGLGDAELVIDAGQWDLLSKRQRVALIDHELTHLEPVLKDGQLARDDLMRPKLQMRLHDIQVGAFTEVAARHGRESIERQQFDAVIEAVQQLELEFSA